MLKARLGGAIAALLISAAAYTPAQALTLVGYFSGNDPFGGQEKGLYGTFNGVQISSPSLAKCDVPGGSLSCSWENGAVTGEDYTSAFTIGFNSSKSGTWGFTGGPTLTHEPAYMAVKASTNWALYALDGALSGIWSTAGLLTPNGKNQAGVSHISFYNSAAPAAVPLPAAAWLLLAGLGGLGAVARKRSARASRS
jgi:hypothetical protein